MRDKVYADAHAALHDLDDEAVIMAGGFGLSGNAEHCIAAIAASKRRDLTLISNNCGNQGQGLAVLLQNGQVKKCICSFIGGNADLEEKMLKGEVEVELCPQGTLAERIRAGGVGIGAFYTPTGVGTVVAEGKDERVLDGRPMILETSLKADYAILRAKTADRYGNLRFYRTSRNFQPAMAMASRITVVEVEELVEVGALDPDDIHLPGLFVKRVFVGKHYKNPIEHRTVRPRVA
jgi:3-oxoacid CoA-transferase subunit A